MMIQKHIGLLGLRMRDKVSGMEGFVTSISFDLYGCVQAVLTPPGVDKDGNVNRGSWFDISRLSLLSDPRVMPVPAFDGASETVAAGAKGPAEKPLP